MCCKESKSKQKSPPVPVLKVASKRQYALNTYHLGPPKLYFPPFVFRDCIYQIPNGNIFNNGIIVTTYNTRSLECIVCFFSPPLLTYKGGSFEPLESPSYAPGTAPVSQRSWVPIPLKPEFFSGLLFNCLSCVYNCDDHSLIHDLLSDKMLSVVKRVDYLYAGKAKRKLYSG